MNKSKMANQIKPRFKLQIEDFNEKIAEFKSSEMNNNVALKPLRSAKNIHELKKFNFDSENVELVNTERRLRKLTQLELQREQLMQSLEILKESALSAIAEKADEIERLKSREPLSSDEKLEFYENELEKSQRVNRELEEQREELQREFYNERSRYVNLLSEKEYQIGTLYDEIIQIRRELDELEQTNLTKNRKIRLLQQENQRLTVQLKDKSLTYSMKEVALDETMRIISPPSQAASLPSYAISQSLENFSLSQVDKSNIEEKIEEINKIHLEEKMELQNYYQNKIKNLREIYQNELALPGKESQKEPSLGRRRSIPKISQQRNKVENLNLNLLDMYAIEEQAEEVLDSARVSMNDLKYQIKLQNLSECANVEPMLRTEQDGDASSQFTTKYFENPFQFLKKNNSLDSMRVIEDHEVKTTLKLKVSNHECDQNKITEQNDEAHHNEEQPSNGIYENKGIFAIGLLSGVTLASLAGFLIKKWQ